MWVILDYFLRVPLSCLLWMCWNPCALQRNFKCLCAFCEEQNVALWTLSSKPFRRQLWEDLEMLVCTWLYFPLSFLPLCETVTWKTGRWENGKWEQKNGVYHRIHTVTSPIGRLMLKCICGLNIFAFLALALGGLWKTSLECFMREKVLNWQKKQA